jgi:hypothetical protein
VLKAISFEKRRGILDGYTREDGIYKTAKRLGTETMGTTEAWMRRKMGGKTPTFIK